MEWTKMISILNTCKPNTILTVYWANGLVVDGVVDTICESDNCLETDNPDYKEYYMCAMKIMDVIHLPNQGTSPPKKGDLIELSIMNEPVKIQQKGLHVIWEK